MWLSTGIKVREWVAVHRKHHAHTDTERDPHSPAVSGWIDGADQEPRDVPPGRPRPPNIDKYAKDLAPTRWDRYLFDHSWLGLLIGTALLCVAFGWQVGLLAAFVHVNYYLAGSAAVNAIGHHFGRRPYDNSATNLQWLAFITAGEGLHNNHHAAPTSAKLSHRWYEIDPGWLVIKPLTWFRLAKVRLTELRLSPAKRTSAGQGRLSGRPAPARAVSDASSAGRVDAHPLGLLGLPEHVGDLVDLIDELLRRLPDRPTS